MYHGRYSYTPKKPLISVISDPPVKKVLYWCPECNVPLIGKKCSCGSESKSIQMLMPYEVRPALSADVSLIKNLIQEKFGPVPLSQILVLNKTGGADRTDLVIMNGDRLGWLIFDPVERIFRFDIAVEALPYIINHVTKGVIDIYTDTDYSKENGRIGGKRVNLKVPALKGTYIVKYKNKYGTGIVKEDTIKVKELVAVEPVTVSDPRWKDVILRNKNHLKNLEYTAIKAIKKHMYDRPAVNVSFSGGKDSMAVLHLGRKAGIKDAFFINTGLEFPETIEYIRSMGVDIIEDKGSFWPAVKRAGPPTKDGRWCCKLLKLNPSKEYLSGVGPCVTVQGNRWYESWNRAGLAEVSQNPSIPFQRNLSPIRSWRALEVFLYLWWQKQKLNPLYDKGFERVGCYLCPAMLESEYETLHTLHPEYAKRWDEFLDAWAKKKGYPEGYRKWGLWRWKVLAPKMREICKEKGIGLNPDHTLKAVPAKKHAK